MTDEIEPNGTARTEPAVFDEDGVTDGVTDDVQVITEDGVTSAEDVFGELGDPSDADFDTAEAQQDDAGVDYDAADGPPDGFEAPQLTPDQAQKMAEKILSDVDDDDTIIPNLPLNTQNLCLWAFESIMIDPVTPGIIITFASTAFPRGIPICIDRERGLKFCSQLKKRLQQGPVIAEAPPGVPEIITPPGGGGKLYGPNGAPLT